MIESRGERSIKAPRDFVIFFGWVSFVFRIEVLIKCLAQ